MNLWFTSDTHFGHENIIKYCKRPFKSLEEMDEKIITKWNERIKRHDQVIHCVDFCFKKGKSFWDYYSQLNGYKTIVKGNHDKNNGTQTKITSLIVSHGWNEYLVVHIPPQHPLEIPEFIDVCLCGHVHEKWYWKWLDDKLLINVGVDVNNFYPISIREIEQLVQKIKKEKI